MKTQWMRLGGVMVLAVAVGACAGETTTDETATSAARDAATGTSGTNDTNVDLDWVREQIAMGEAEIELGQLAQQKGAHAQVKQFGEMMVRDHQAAGQELKQILNQATTGTTGDAARENAAAREEHAENRRNKLEDLRKLSGNEFDRQYIEQMIDDHQKAVDQLEGKAENANNPGVKQWASKTLPKVQQHLERARTIQQTLENRNQ